MNANVYSIVHILKGELMQPQRKGKISTVLQVISIVPLLIFGLVLMGIAYRQFTTTMYEEIEIEMRNNARNLQTLLDVSCPGDYRLVGTDSLSLYKGPYNITSSNFILDKVKEDTSMDVTLFYQDTRILTTIRNSQGVRIVGSPAPDIVLEQVLNGNEDHLYTNTLVNNKRYFSYYSPLHNSDGSTVGMLFVGKPSDVINDKIMQSIYPLLIADFCVMIVIALFIFLYTHGFGTSLLKIRTFLGEISTGNLNASLDGSVLLRNDEFGDIGRSALSMQSSLRHMVEQDTLTELFNRRSANRKLQQVISRSETSEMPFCLAIGDIDFFKKINDTYGHDCGDVVLKEVAKTLRKHMRTNGFVARWGGEEFLLVFDHSNTETAYNSLCDLLDSVRALRIPYGEHIIQLTMTFGLSSCDNKDVEVLFKQADDKLYDGKSGGRNRVVR